MTHTLIFNGTLIDGRGGEPLPDTAVWIEGDRLRQIGPEVEMDVPGGCRRIDARGGFILPGFIDCHVHLVAEGFNVMESLTTPLSFNFYKSIEYMRRTVEAGVTSVRDAGGADLGMKLAVERGLVLGPRMQVSITVLTCTGGHADFWLRSGNETFLHPPYPGRPEGRCDGEDGVRRKVREVLRAGAEVIKICATGGVISPNDHPLDTQFTVRELQAAVEEAAFRRGTKVMAHAQGTQGIKNAVRAGVHSVEHGIFLDQEAIELMVERGTYLVPTLIALNGLLEAARHRPVLPAETLAQAEQVVQMHQKSIAMAHRAGVKIAFGTDAAAIPHGTNLRELGLMCDAGMSPMEAIVAATRNAAECLGWQDRVGTLEPAKLADLLIARRNPLDDIRVLEKAENIALVMKGGEVIRQRATEASP
ncbi:MAG: amidohydrolase family protein [Holophagales bacterium]|nr:amidohydrolase family protein [Holophagales bacterium]